MQLAQDLLAYTGHLAKINKEIVGEHKKDPYGLIIGDDVSARIPTLITHRFLRLALADKRMSEVPQTRFMASGSLPEDQKALEETWQNNLQTRAGELLGQVSVANVLIITESQPAEDSVSIPRMMQAFAAHGARTSYKVTKTAYLGDWAIAADERDFVGFEKVRPEAISRTQTPLHPQKIAAFRGFLRDYTDSLYRQAFGPIKPGRRQHKNVLEPNDAAARYRRFGI